MAGQSNYREEGGVGPGGQRQDFVLTSDYRLLPADLVLKVSVSTAASLSGYRTSFYMLLFQSHMGF